MNAHTTSTALSKSSAPATSTLMQLNDAVCTNERALILFETVLEKLSHAAHEMPEGEGRDSELRDCWTLFHMTEQMLRDADMMVRESAKGLGANGGVQ